MNEYLWAIVPALDLVELTLQVVADLLAQSIPVRVLLIDQGSSEASNDAFRTLAEQSQGRVLLWSFTTPLPSLSAAWNAGLAFVWSLGQEEALVVNSDIRLWAGTAARLRAARQETGALFVTGVGVTEEQWVRFCQHPEEAPGLESRGGPDFSCYLITKVGHEKYPFPEGCIPAYGEDCWVHREYLLGGDGSRIFSIDLPFHHIGGGSRTVNQSKEARERFERLRGIGAAHYRAAWGGNPNQETFIQPFSGDPWPNVTLPELQARVQAGLQPLDGVIRAQMTTDVVEGEVLFQRELSPEEATHALNLALAKKVEEIRDQEAVD